MREGPAAGRRDDARQERQRMNAARRGVAVAFPPGARPQCRVAAAGPEPSRSSRGRELRHDRSPHTVPSGANTRTPLVSVLRSRPEGRDGGDAAYSSWYSRAGRTPHALSRIPLPCCGLSARIPRRRPGLDGGPRSRQRGALGTRDHRARLPPRPPQRRAVRAAVLPPPTDDRGPAPTLGADPRSLG